MIFTAVIMAAGKGTRMGELTKRTPKHLLPVLGRPFLEHTFDRLRAAGFRRIVVCVQYLAEAFDHYASDDIVIVRQPDNGKYGTAAVIEAVRSTVGEQPFACIAGDNLYSTVDLKKASVDSSSTWIGGFRTAAWRGMGILKQTDEGYLDQIIEKPTTFVGDLVNASLYRFGPAIYQAVESITPSIRGEYEITDAINLIAKQELVNVFELEERWFDLTVPDDIQKIERALQPA